MLFMRIPKYQATTRRALILVMCTKIKIGVPSVEILPMWKDFSGLQRNSSVKFAISLDILLVFATKKKQASFKSRISRPKAHHLQACTVYEQKKAICRHSKDYSSSDGSICLQIKVQHMQASLKKTSTPTHLIS